MAVFDLLTWIFLEIPLELLKSFLFLVVRRAVGRLEATRKGLDCPKTGLGA